MRHEKIDKLEAFKLSQNDLAEFRKYIDSKGFSYSTNAEKLLGELKKSSEKEHYYASIDNEYQALKNKLLEVKTNDFEKHIEEIDRMLSNEIIMRYYHQKGQMKYALQKDDYISKAIAVIGDPAKYQGILNGKYKPAE
jgi:carboxyl-terminal processing protease